MKITTILIITSMAVLSIGCAIFHKIRLIPKHVEQEFLSDENSITYIGHATVLIHLGSVNIITDPVFSNYIGRFAKRYIEPGIKFEKLPSIDAILVSHEHNDHLDKPSLKRFKKEVLFHFVWVRRCGGEYPESASLPTRVLNAVSSPSFSAAQNSVPAS